MVSLHSSSSFKDAIDSFIIDLYYLFLLSMSQLPGALNITSSSY